MPFLRSLYAILDFSCLPFDGLYLPPEFCSLLGRSIVEGVRLSLSLSGELFDFAIELRICVFVLLELCLELLSPISIPAGFTSGSGSCAMRVYRRRSQIAIEGVNKNSKVTNAQSRE
jgi:hypothetical protein